MKTETKTKTKIKAFWVTTSRTLEQACVCMSSAYVCRLDHVYADPYLEALINTETKQQPKM